MNILLTNDDGYNAEGILALARRLSREHKVFMVAPESERSGASHAVSFFSGITYRKIKTYDGVESYTVDGSPADCVLFALRYLLKDRIDVVISGINSVLNVGTDVMYSGTFGAAQEATYQQYKGIAVSLEADGGNNYSFAADFVAENLDALARYADGRVTVNVNIPFAERRLNKGVKIARVAFRPYKENYVIKPANNGAEVFFVSGKPLPQLDCGDCGDAALIEQGYITITPVAMLSNAEEAFDKLNKTEFLL